MLVLMICQDGIDQTEIDEEELRSTMRKEMVMAAEIYPRERFQVSKNLWMRMMMLMRLRIVARTRSAEKVMTNLLTSCESHVTYSIS